MDPPPIVVSCPVTVFSRSELGHLTPIGNHSRLTVNYVEGYGHPQSIIVYDENRHEQLKILVVTDAARYKITDQFNHEISRHEDTSHTTIILVFHQENEENVRAFTNLMEIVFKKLHRFNSVHAMDCPSGSDDDDPNNGAVIYVRPATPIVTFWDCVNCQFGSSDEHGWMCGECRSPRLINWDLEWQCRCHRVFDNNRISECNQCGMWRCHICTVQHMSTSLRCHSCQTPKSDASLRLSNTMDDHI